MQKGLENALHLVPNLDGQFTPKTRREDVHSQLCERRGRDRLCSFEVSQLDADVVLYERIIIASVEENRGMGQPSAKARMQS